MDEINDQQSSAELWKRVNAIQGKRRARGMALRVNDAITRDPDTIADSLAEYFGDLSSFKRYPPAFIRNHATLNSELANIQIPPSRGESHNKPFTMPELNFALGRANGKSAGPDEIGYPMLKKLPHMGKKVVLEQINNVWMAGTLPASWKKSLVVPIPKANGKNTDTSGYRPIALTNCLSKIAERMVNRRLTEFLEENRLLDHRQHAFRKR